MAAQVAAVRVGRGLARHLQPAVRAARSDKANGRLHTRRCTVRPASRLPAALRQRWPGLRSAIPVESTREAPGRQPSGPVTEWWCYISSRELPAAEFSPIIQQHWHIENRCHWALDVVFDEDACRVRHDHGAENLVSIPTP